MAAFSELYRNDVNEKFEGQMISFRSKCEEKKVANFNRNKIFFKLSISNSFLIALAAVQDDIK